MRTLLGGRVLIICIGLTCFTFLTVAASAQSASFRSVDTNSDGVLTFDELVAEFGRDGANRLLLYADHNGDRRVTVSELRRAADDYDQDDGDTGGDDGGGGDEDSGDDGDDGGDDGDDD
ncbi:MAG: hypothetical protein AAFY99_05515 [Pseudomonadota bacterium]